MRAIIKGKWFVLLAWIAVIAVLFMSAPNMEQLVREKGQISVPEGYSSTLAEEILNDVQMARGKGALTGMDGIVTEATHSEDDTHVVCYGRVCSTLDLNAIFNDSAEGTHC